MQYLAALHQFLAVFDLQKKGHYALSSLLFRKYQAHNYISQNIGRKYPQTFSKDLCKYMYRDVVKSHSITWQTAEILFV